LAIKIHNVKLSYCRDSARYAVQGHSRSLMLVPIESLYATSIRVGE